MHQGVKYPCNVCGKEFTQSGSLTLHVKKEHEENNTEETFKKYVEAIHKNNKASLKQQRRLGLENS